MRTPGDPTLRRVAWAGWWFFVATLVASGLLDLVDGGAGRATASTVADAATFVLVVGTFPVSGLLVLRQQPSNSVGWLLLSVGDIWAVGSLADAYATYGLTIEPGSLPLASAGAAVSNAIWAPALGVMSTFLLLRFPDGRLPGPRWRPLARLSAAVLVSLTALLLVTPGELIEGPLAGEPNPLGVESLRPVADLVLAALILGLTACSLACAWSLVVRFRRSHGVERQQLKWMTAAGSVVALALLTNVLVSEPSSQGPEPGWLLVLDNLAFATWALLPVATATAVLRHGLYDIDVVINRALVYGSLTACLAAVYLGSVLLLQLVLRPLTERSDLAVAASTLGVAALFGPVRARMQVAVDRRFYRHKYDAARTVADFSTTLQQEIDLDTIGTDLVRVADEAVQPVAVTLWLVPAVTVPGRAPTRKDAP